MEYDLLFESDDEAPVNVESRLAPGATTANHLPMPFEKRRGVALCLSGGGYRAALFHLGALRRLNELGILSKVDRISSVSGGSIISAHLATHLCPWPEWGIAAPDWEERVAEPFRLVAQTDIRTRPVLKSLLPWNWFNSGAGIDALAAEYGRVLTAAHLKDLPAYPEFIFCATDLPFGVNWEFQRQQIGDYQAGYVDHLKDYPLAQVVAASSCFPPVFGPMPWPLDPKDFQRGKAPPGTADALRGHMRLSDGGVYDNMALEPVWQDSKVVLVSNGGGLFQFADGGNLITRLLRYNSIMGSQAEDVRKRWLISNYQRTDKYRLEGTYWGIGSARTSYGLPPDIGYSKDLAVDVIAQVRTDLNEFSDAEIDVLENHGYLLADAAICTYAQRLAVEPDKHPLRIPHPQWMDEDSVKRALRNSARHFVWPWQRD